MGKFDLIATSRKKGYRIAMIVLIVVGGLMLALGFVLLGTLTSTRSASRLDVEFSGRNGTNGDYYANISSNIYLNVLTDIPADQALQQPIQFYLQDGAEDFITVADYQGKYAIDHLDYSGYCQLIVRDDVPANATGTLYIKCGQHLVRIQLTYVPK